MKLKNPFPGIRPFREDEGEFFFGRDHQIAELLTKLSLGSFVAVVGTSGCGKSSLVRAGLIPRLHKEDWLVSVFRPQSPLDNLRLTLESIPFEFGDYETRDEFREIWREMVPDNLMSSSNGIVESYKQSGSKKKLIIIIDQFEELFAYQKKNNDNRDNAIRFINLLIQAVQQKEFPIHVLITLRSDQLGRCSEFKGLPEVINDGLFLVPRLSREQYREAIMRPLLVQDIKVASNLVSQLLNDIEDDPDQLPVLQHSLMVTFDGWIERAEGPGYLIEMKDYQAAGGMAQSIDTHCNLVFQKLKGKNLALPTEIIFQRLTEINLEGVETRCATSLVELVELTGTRGTEVIEILDVFRSEGCNFLMPPIDVPLTQDTLIDLSHECIMRKWKTLNAWILKEEENKRFLQRLLEHWRNYMLGERGPLKNPTLSAYKSWEKFLNGESLQVIRWGARYTERFKEALSFIKTSIHWDNKRKQIKLLLLIAVPIVVVTGSLYIIEKIHSIEHNRTLNQFIIDSVKLEQKKQTKLAELRRLDVEIASKDLEKQRKLYHELNERLLYVTSQLNESVVTVNDQKSEIDMLSTQVITSNKSFEEIKKDKEFLIRNLVETRKNLTDSLKGARFIRDLYFEQLKNNYELLAYLEAKVKTAKTSKLMDDRSIQLVSAYIDQIKSIIPLPPPLEKIEVYYLTRNGALATELINFMNANGYKKDVSHHSQSENPDYKNRGILLITRDENLLSQLQSILKGSKYGAYPVNIETKWHNIEAKNDKTIIVLDF